MKLKLVTKGNKKLLFINGILVIEGDKVVLKEGDPCVRILANLKAAYKAGCHDDTLMIEEF